MAAGRLFAQGGGEKGLAKGCCYGFSVVSGGIGEFSEFFAVMHGCIKGGSELIGGTPPNHFSVL